MDEIKNKLKEFIAENILFSDNGYPYQDADSFLEKGIVRFDECDGNCCLC